MKALAVRRPGGPEELSWEDRPSPVPSSGEVLVRVKAAALNRADLLQRRGHYPPPPGVTDVLGLEAAGVVESVGGRAGRWKPGDRVMALMAGGGQAEFAAVHEGLLMPVPENFSFEQAAAVPEAFLTAYNALVRLGGLAPGRTALVHAAAGGVGTAALQIVREMGGKSFATAGSPEKAEACRRWGAERVSLYKDEDFVAQVSEWTGGRGVDIILDMVGGPYADKHLDCVAEGGRWIVLGFLGGPRARNLDLARVLFKRVRIEGTALRARGDEDKAQLVREFSDWALPLFAAGRLKPVVDRTFPWTAAADAHRYMEENRNVGKIVLTMP